MKQYRYVRKLPVTVSIPLFPFLSVILGFSILAWVIWPILSFQLQYLSVSGTISPLPDNFISSVLAQETDQVDYTKASSWFPHNPSAKTVTPVDTYTLSIPKLRISKAMVKIGTDDLSNNLIHYGGTAVPGKAGNTVIFGHSVLPQFFNPSNYLTIFSTLPTLKEGDSIFIKYDGVDYRYEVLGKRITDPDDVSGLEQSYDNSYITLVTCVPPGTYLKRLWLTARLRPFGT